MPVFQGNISGSIKSSPLNIASTISSFSLANKTGGSITVSVYISHADGSDVLIAPDSKTLGNGDIYISNTPIKVLKDYYILIVSSGSLDYYFSID